MHPDLTVLENGHSVRRVHVLERRLAVFNRFEEALACGTGGPWPETPLPLLKRAAWIHFRQGNLGHAIRELKQTLEKHPTDFVGWQMLAEWSVETEQLDDAIGAAGKMSVLAPHDPVPLGYARDLLLRQKKNTEAPVQFERAFNLDPKYEFAGLSLLDLLLKEKDIDKAGEVIQRMRQHADSERLEARVIRWWIIQNDKARALEHFEALCGRETENGWCIHSSAEVLINARMTSKVRRTLKRLLKEPLINPWAGSVWVQLRFNQHLFRPGKKFHQLLLLSCIGC